MSNAGGRTRLWLGDGSGSFSEATEARMPDVWVRFSWELELVDVDNDFDLDVLVSCKKCEGSFLFENDGRGFFTDVTDGRLPQFDNNYDFEAMDVDGDGFLDLVTINDGSLYREHLFLNDRNGGFRDATTELWPRSENPPCDDNMAVFLDFDSDGDADLLIASLSCADRLLRNEGAGHLKRWAVLPGCTRGTLGIAVADLNGDHRLDVVQAQGEAAFPEKVFFAETLPPDTAPPSIGPVEAIDPPVADGPVQIRARVHDRKSPTLPHDWRAVTLRWEGDGRTHETPMQWYGEYLWRATLEPPPADTLRYRVCATDAAGNAHCSEPYGFPRPERGTRGPHPNGASRGARVGPEPDPGG